MAVIEPHNQSNQQHANDVCNAIEKQEQVVKQAAQLVQKAADKAGLDVKTGARVEPK